MRDRPRFGLFFQLLDRQLSAATIHHVSPALGAILALLGSIAAGVASFQHGRFCRSLRPEQMPAAYRPSAASVVSYGVAVAGAVLATLVLI